MILTFKVSSCGLNLQKKSWNSTFIDPPPNVPIGLQAVGRQHRIGCPSSTVFVWEFYLRKSFNDRHLANNLRKALPSMMAELTGTIFLGEGLGVMEDEDIYLG